MRPYPNRPIPYRPGKYPVRIPGHMTEFVNWRHVIPQPIRGQSLAARRKTGVEKRLDLERVLLGFNGKRVQGTDRAFWSAGFQVVCP